MNTSYATNLLRHLTLSTLTLAVTLIASNSLSGCFIIDGDDTIAACPGESAADVMCSWEGPVSYSMTQLYQGEGFVFVRATVRWEPCGATPGEQIRTYRIDPMTGATTRLDLLPSSAVEMGEVVGDPIELPIADSNILVRLLRSINGSVTATKLKIGDIVDNTTGADMAPIEIDVICQE